MVGEPTFLQTQRPEDLKNRSHPGRRGHLGIAMATSLKPAGYAKPWPAERMKPRGSEQSKPDDQRRTVEASGTRSASFSFGAAFSQEQCSLNRATIPGSGQTS